MRRGKLGEKKNKYLDIFPVNRNDFYDCDSFLNIYYRKSITEVSKYHWFYYSNNSKGIVIKRTTVRKEDKGSGQRLVNYSRNASDLEIKKWKRTLMKIFSINETAQGISEIKQVELFTKWREFIPEEYRDIMCPNPDDDIIERIKAEKSANANKKADERKERMG